MKWIPIKKKLPDFGELVILKFDKTKGDSTFGNNILNDEIEIGYLVNINKDGYHFKIKHVDGETFPDEWMEIPKSRKKRKCKNEKENKKRTEERVVDIKGNEENIEINLETNEDSPELLEKRKVILRINEKVILKIKTNLEIDHLHPIANYSEYVCDTVIAEYNKLLQQLKNPKTEIVVD